MPLGVNWLKRPVSQFTLGLDVHQNHCSWQWSAGIQNGGSILNAAAARLCHGECSLQTGSMAHLWAFPIRCLPDWWHSPRPPPSRHSSVLIYSSSLCDLALALPSTSPAETPRGHIHYYLESRRAKASDGNMHVYTPSPARTERRLISLTLGLC